MYSIIVKNGTIIDGTGKPKYQADLGVKDDLIAKIKPKIRGKAETMIDATGLYVCPGFIDIFNHSDDYWTLFTIPSQESLLYQGITTILGGNAGSSLAPLIDANVIENIRKWANINEVMVNWQKMSEYLTELAKRKLALNYATLAGYETLYRGIAGETLRPLKTYETATMVATLKEALAQGAFGLSFGLSFNQSSLISQESLETILGVVAQANGFFAVHIRGEREEFLPSVRQAVALCRASGVSLEINHLKVVGKENWSQLDKALGLIDEANNEGLNLDFDIYPYTRTGSSILVLLPDWLAEGGEEATLNRLADPVIRSRAMTEMQKEHYDYDKITVVQAKNQRTFIGKTISQIAVNEACSPEQAILNVLLANEGQALVMIEALSEENFVKSLKHPLALVASDGVGYNLNFSQKGLLVHPRSFGTMPRILGRYVREQGIISWEKAIQKMTANPAKKIGLAKRGSLAQGNFADMAVFDPKTIQDTATFDNPFQYAKGIEYLLVNGQTVIERGQYNGRMLGRVLVKKQT